MKQEPHGNVEWMPLQGTVMASNMHFPTPWPELMQTFIDAPHGKGRWHVSLKKVGHLVRGEGCQVGFATYEGTATTSGAKFKLTVINDL